MQRFLSIYLILAILGFYCLELPILEHFYTVFGVFLANLSGFVIHLFDPSIVVSGAILSQPNGGFSIKVTTECQAIELTWLYCIAILAWRATWWHKLLWMLLGIGILQVLNVMRLISLVYLGQWYPQHFVMIHENFYPLFFGIATILIFLYWILFISATERSAS